MNKVSKKTVKPHENHQKKISFQVRTIVPPELHHIQPISAQVWNCDEIGFEPNRIWHKVVCTYKLFQGERMWKVKNGERVPFWFTLIASKRTDGKRFMPHIIVQWDKDYYQDLNHNIPLDCTVHHKPSGYMDRDRWLKAMNQLSNICGASPVNNQILLFYVHYSHFDERYLTQIQRKKSSPSYLKRVTSSATSPIKTGLTQNWSISTSFWRISGCWSMVPRGLNLTT